MIEVLAAAQPEKGLNVLALIGTFFFMGVVLYLFIVRPQRLRLRQQQSVQDSLEVGDDIMTSAGILGTVTEIDEEADTVTVEIAPGTEVHMVRRAIAQRLAEEPVDDEDYSDDESGGEDEGYSEEESGGEEAGSQP
jgi:preprotein translocase subunit YajC